MGFWDDSGISWTICKLSAPRSRQITTLTPHQSIFTGRVLFLTPNWQCQSTECTMMPLMAPSEICSVSHTHARTHAHTHTHPFHGPFPGLPRWAGTRKVKPIWILLKQDTVSGIGISWAICKSAPRSRQITTPAPHHSCRPTNSVKALYALKYVVHHKN